MRISKHHQSDEGGPFQWASEVWVTHTDSADFAIELEMTDGSLFFVRMNRDEAFKLCSELSLYLRVGGGRIRS
jgi:hypothetical protein